MLPEFAERVSWPPARAHALRTLGCPAAVIAAADGASAAFGRLRAASASTLQDRATAMELASEVALTARDMVDFSWEELHAGPWKKVSLTWRELYGTATLQMAACKLLLVRRAFGAEAGEGNEEMWQSELLACIKLLDMGIMMGGPFTQPTLAYAMAECERLHQAPAAHAVRPAGETAKRLQGGGCQQGLPAAKRQRGLPQEPSVQTDEMGENHQERDGDSGGDAPLPTASAPTVGALPLPPKMEHARACQLRRRSLPPLEAFLKEHMQMRAPVVITNGMQEWPAMRPLPPTAAGPLAVPIDQGEILPGRVNTQAFC